MNRKMHGRENDSVQVVEDAPKSEVALREEAMLEFWREHDIFKKTLEAPAGIAPVGDFVFYDGPPFATGLPHYGHILAGTMKDAIPRFWTMNGYRVKRKWGWDCHGLPLENLIEKELGLANKKDIEEYGIENFNAKARGAVLRYADDWRRIVPRMGRFVDMQNDYRTMDSTYTESVWWVFKQLHEKGLVFEGFKGMHLCPRCGTTLSNFEVNQGYKDIKDIAVTVRLPLLDASGEKTDTSLLVWTTTPWTLPGNTAAAVHKDIEYVKVKVTTDDLEEYVVLAKGRLAQLGDLKYEVIDTFTGAKLVGNKYQPPYPYMQEQDLEQADKAWTIYHADYVEVGEEGTGAVHIAPAYGEDDLILAQANDLPVHHHVDLEGRFKDFVTSFAGQLVKPKDDDEAGVTHLDADILVTRDLKEKGAIFKKENITHSYPHCWRDDTPLLNYATTSWFVNVPKIKDALVAANNTVDWVPAHVGDNRFGKWLEGARDWAVSRQRYWGAPLPVWRNPETGDYKVFGSLAELQQYVPRSGNTYYAIRHGESEFNVAKILNSDPSVENPLTENGIVRTREAAKNLPTDIDYIYYSPLPRTKQTALLLAEELGLSSEQVIAEDRIRESGLTAVEGKSHGAKKEFFSSQMEEFDKEVAGIENLNSVRSRIGSFVEEMEEKYTDKKIVVVSHGDPLWMFDVVMAGADKKTACEMEKDYPKNAEIRERTYTKLPHNEFYELDFHRPYIDTIDLYEDGVKLERVPDVFDCWFESGSMPYAQHHYPFESKDTFEKDAFPAQFIAEGLDQTRGWFYSMLVLGVALFGKSPYENVIVNGLVLAEDGKKMSKSLQNYPDPMELADRTGIDAMRFYLLSSPVIKGEDLHFSEKEVQELQRKNIGRLHNVLAMYEMFTPASTSDVSSERARTVAAHTNSSHVLDRWILSRLNQLTSEVTAGYKSYELDKATRPITEFIDDMSVWYLRRSRDRLKGTDEGDKKAALGTLRYTLRTLSLTMAPVMPFYAEYLWQAVRGEEDAESVHLGAWPMTGPVDDALLRDMSKTRMVVTAALEARTKAGIKVRQPLASLMTNELLTPEFTNIIAEEVNVKVVSTEGSDIAVLDVTLTEALLVEGAARELMRAIQGKRKKEGLEPHDQIILTVATGDAGRSAIESHIDMIKHTVGAADVLFAETEGESVNIGDYSFAFSFQQ